MKVKKQKLPDAVKACLWSYDTEKMSISDPDHRFRIIMNVLNHGKMEAVEWLWKNVSEEDIKGAIQNSYGSEWNKPSLSLWSLIYGVRPLKSARFAV